MLCILIGPLRLLQALIDGRVLVCDEDGGVPRDDEEHGVAFVPLTHDHLAGDEYPVDGRGADRLDKGLFISYYLTLYHVIV